MKYIYKLLPLLLLLGISRFSKAQCPANMDFELGNYSNWTYYTGTVDNIIPSTYVWHWSTGSSAPTSSYHTLTSGGVDPYGGFSTVGAGAYSLQLNGPYTGFRASKAEYQFVVPAGASVYYVDYSYAVVLQNPTHPLYTQARFAFSAFNVTDGVSVPCSDYEFVSTSVAADGFTQYGTTDIWYLPWQPGGLVLRGCAGKTITLSFSVGDCTGGAHFGYAYVDIDTCATWADTMTACYPDSLTLPTAPSGFMTYKWYDPSWTLIGTGASIAPFLTPSTTTTYAVIMTPYAGYGCTDTLYVTVVPISVSPIVGPTRICIGGAMTLSDATSGGSWSSSSTPVATVGSSSGIVTGVSAGTTTITYKLTTGGCYVTSIVTVYPMPSISGLTTLCTGGSATLSTAVSGGTWSSSSTVVTVGSTSGIVTGGSTAGTSVITYTLSAGCVTTTTVTVILPPAPITGTLTLCQFATTALTDATGGGTWSSSNIFVATVGSSGIVFGVAGGTATITYSIGVGCNATAVVTVNPLPSIVTGATTLCVGQTSSFSSSSTPGTWSSSNTSVATVDTYGVVTGVGGPGTSNITYTLSTGCYSVVPVTVNPLPDPITGIYSVCVGDYTQLSDATAGGTWSSSITTVATIGSTGLVYGAGAGTSVISYTLSTGCAATVIVTVNPLPAAITGSVVCLGLTTALSDATPGGTWSSSNTFIATIGSGTGLITGIALGTAVITYQLSTGCYIVTTVTVNPVPDFDAPPRILCVGLSASMNGYGPGGTYSSSAILTASVTLTTGVVTGVSPGTATITYTLPSGCWDTSVITIVGPPAAISGSSSLCEGDMITLSDATPGGVWSSSNTGVATVGYLSGVVTGISGGTVDITYATPGGCEVYRTLTVIPLPNIITGTLTVCAAGATTALSDATPGGTWSSGNTLVATVDPVTGVVTGVAVGTASITYAAPCLAIATVTVFPLPSVIMGEDSVCSGASITLSDASTGGVWSSDNTAIATVAPSSGVVTGVLTGTATITYTSTEGCITTFVITVDSTPVVAPITGYDTLCVSGTTTLSDATSGGTWSSSDLTVATINSITGDVTAGTISGTAIISYSVSNQCGVSVVTDTVVVVVPVPPIIGDIGVCSGDKDTLYNAVAGGIWSSSDSTIAKVDSVTGIVTGVRTGSVIITYTATSPCGLFTVTMNVTVNMATFITTSTRLACQTYNPDFMGHGQYVISDTSCMLVCDSSIVRYYGYAVAHSTFTWTVTGGTIINDYGDSVDVFWPFAGTSGTVTLTTLSGNCFGKASACINVVSKPHAYFAPSSVNVCLDGSVLMFDSSFTLDPLSPIVSWRWEFGDGTAYAGQFPPAHSYSVMGTDTVTLTVKNACGCANSYKVVLNVDIRRGPKIICPGIVCDSEIATYSTPNTCGTYLWNVIGGTIVSGLGTSSINVRWDHADSHGYGYVMLWEPCAICPDTTTIQIPVIQKNVAILGPDTVCVGSQVVCSLPLWGATQYRWGVIGFPSAVVGYRDDHQVVLNFPVAGTYTVHGWYQNRLKLCGGNVDKTITVLPVETITGPFTPCQGTSGSYTLTPGSLSGNWKLTDMSGSVVSSGVGSSFPVSFYTPGTFFVSASGSFCTNPITISVQPTLPAPDSITGPDTICLGRHYKYIAYTHVSGATFDWQITGGSVNPPSGSDTVDVVWDNMSTMQLFVRLKNKTSPNCPGPQIMKAIIKDTIINTITGNLTPCSDGTDTFACSYVKGETYDWEIIPNIAGSVIKGNHDPKMTVQWNAYTGGSAAIVVTIHKCNTTVHDTLNVSVTPPVMLTVTASPVPACAGTPVTFTASSGGVSYYWEWGDGYTSTSSTNTDSHAFPPNTTSGNIIYHVRVTATGHTGLCPFSGAGTYNMSIKPSPVAHASTAFPRSFCDTTYGHLIGTVTNSVGSLSYQWYDASGMTPTAISGATHDTVNVFTTGYYYFHVTGSNGCSSNSNTLYIAICWTPTPPPPGDTTGDTTHYPPSPPPPPPLPGCSFSVTATYSCNVLTLTAPSGATGTWYAYTTPATGPISISTPTLTVTYDTPGIYQFQYTGTYAGCTANEYVNDTVGIIPHFTYQWRCPVGGVDTIVLRDNSAYLPFWFIDSIAWYEGTTRLGAGSTVSIGRPPGTTVTIIQNVYGRNPDGTFLCSSTQTIVLPAQPVPTFTDTLSPICEGVPIRFTAPGVPGVIGYHWSYGDSSYSYLQNSERTYNWKSFGNPHTYTATLTVTDTFGCNTDTTGLIGIYENNLFGNVAVSGTVCSGSLPYTLGYASFVGTPTTYVWSTGDTTHAPLYNVYESGAYWVTVFDVHQCQKTFPDTAIEVKVIKVPVPQITGNVNYCDGETVKLLGKSESYILYQWTRDGVVVGTSGDLADAGLPVGSYGYQLMYLVVDTATGDTCSSMSVIDSVFIHPAPPKPLITGPVALSCPLYHLQLTATEPMLGFFNWSDGFYTPMAYSSVNDIYTGGPYLVGFTDMNGCRSFDTVFVPQPPDYYFPYFATGCYTMCQDQLPITLPGVPDVLFNTWSWLQGDTLPLLSGTGLMSSYTVDSAGTYEWELGNGLCTQRTGDLNISVVACDGCQPNALHATVLCDPGNPASYTLMVTFMSPAPGTSYILGTDIGPITPFSGIFPGAGVYSMTLTFTTLYPTPPPIIDSVTIEIAVTKPDGTKCFQKVRVPVPVCPPWAAEKHSNSGDTTKKSMPPVIANALLVFPNPSSGNVTVSYDYGTETYAERSLTVYDQLGRKMRYDMLQDARGNWNIDAAQWAGGVYILRMEADGKTLQTQRFVITGH